MFHKQYYRLEEAAQKLGVDVETLIQNYRDLSICTKIKERIFFDTCESVLIGIKEIIRHASDAAINKRIESLGGLDAVIAMEKIDYVFSADLLDEVHSAVMNVPIIKEEKQKDITETLGNTISGYCRVLGFDEDERGIWVRIVSSSTEFTPIEKVNALILSDEYFCERNELLITHTELTRLLALKAEHDGKPTAEQLQQQLGEANARIAELEAAKNNDNKGKQKQREQALNYWIAGKGAESVKPMTQSEVHEELKRVNGLFQIAESTFEDFWQAQKLIELDAGKR
jgi:hypothetical protein